MFTIYETQSPETVLYLPSGVDFRSQDQRDKWELDEYNRSVAERVECRTEQQESTQ